MNIMGLAGKVTVIYGPNHCKVNDGEVHTLLRSATTTNSEA